MKRVLIGILIGLELIFMGLVFVWKRYDKIKPMGHKVIRVRKYVKLKPETYR